MKFCIILCLSILLTGCSGFHSKNGNISIYNCQSNYVKYLKYDESEIFKFKKEKIKKAYIENGQNYFNECKSYPCISCNKYLCKRHSIKEISFIDKDNSKVKFKLNNINKTFKKSKNKKIKKEEYKYIWSIYFKENSEYETLKNISNGKIIYEMVTEKNKKGDILNTCEVETYSVFNSFFLNY